jgi:nitroimidazol reductase NimA-like FMN-containing flavoprotein (pyridoxamine 5'-phosphate oxidase superfamily)
MDDGQTAERRREEEMARTAPATDLDRRFSSPGARASSWRNAEQRLREAGVWWLSTVTPDGRPHVVPLIAVWRDGALYFATGEEERKAKNLAENPHVTLTTGSNDLIDGFDLVVEGEARLVRDDAKIRRVANAYATKYGEGWRLPGLEGVVLFEVIPSKAFGFGRRHGDIGPPSGEGELFSQTRWRFRTEAADRRSRR